MNTFYSYVGPSLRRAFFSIGAWMLVGMFCGLLQRHQVGDNMVSAVSSIIAGGIVYGFLGIIACLFQARGHDTLLGAVLGFSIGLISLSAETASLMLPTDGLTTTIGALIMSTAKPIISALLSIRFPLHRFWRNVEQRT